MNAFMKWLLMLIALLAAIATPSAQSQVPSPQHSVLYLSIDNLANPYIGELFLAFKNDVRQDMNDAVTIFTENLDLSRFSGATYDANLADWLRLKYQNRKIDVIVSAGPAPLKYLLGANPPLWSGVPIVFVSATQDAIAKLRPGPHVTGKTSELRLADMVNLAKAVLPNTKRMALVGNAPERDSYRQFFASELAALSDKLEFIDLRGKPMAELKQRVAALPDDAVVYYTGLTEDSAGNTFYAQEALEWILRAASRPVFSDNATYLGRGVLGGVVSDPGKRGRDAAQLTVRLLRGELPASIPIEIDKLAPAFDWRELKRWGIDGGRLPAGSDIRFYQPGLWELYRWQIVLTVLLIVLQSILVAALLLERRRRARAVEESRQRLAEIAHMNRNATASVWSATLAHELNQPLAAILSNAEAAEIFLASATPPLNEIREILSDIRRDDRRASELIQRMRALLKKDEIGIEVVNLNDVVKDVLQFLSSEARVRGVDLTTNLAYHHPLVHADRAQLQQVIINLIVNSMDALAITTTGKKSVRVSTVVSDKQAELVVQDSGPGFGENIGHVFDSFFTTKAHGMGLGLSIAASIIDEYGGSIRPEHGADGGAIVRFSLPLQSGPRQ